MGHLMKSFLKKIFNITEMEQALEETRRQIEKIDAIKKQAEEAAKAALKEAEEAKLTPKDRATARKEPWVAVLNIKMNADNVRNGFFELDWNEYFIIQLRQSGYGFEGDLEEEIVDRWFRDIVRLLLTDEGLDPTTGSGYINVVPISKGKSEIS
jgi:CRISPR/Cas system CSM-associated protein Csm4 (group 5 of RAMP superfamily)